METNYITRKLHIIQAHTFDLVTIVDYIIIVNYFATLPIKDDKILTSTVSTFLTSKILSEHNICDRFIYIYIYIERERGSIR